MKTTTYRLLSYSDNDPYGLDDGRCNTPRIKVSTDLLSNIDL